MSTIDRSGVASLVWCVLVCLSTSVLLAVSLSTTACSLRSFRHCSIRLGSSVLLSAVECDVLSFLCVRVQSTSCVWVYIKFYFSVFIYLTKLYTFHCYGAVLLHRSYSPTAFRINLRSRNLFINICSMKFSKLLFGVNKSPVVLHILYHRWSSVLRLNWTIMMS